VFRDADVQIYPIRKNFCPIFNCAIDRGVKTLSVGAASSLHVTRCSCVPIRTQFPLA